MESYRTKEEKMEELKSAAVDKALDGTGGSASLHEDEEKEESTDDESNGDEEKEDSFDEYGEDEEKEENTDDEYGTEDKDEYEECDASLNTASACEGTWEDTICTIEETIWWCQDGVWMSEDNK